MDIEARVQQDITAILSRAFEVAKTNILAALTKLGEECVNRVRNRSQEESWIDHTGNLRNSIAYAVIAEGRQVAESINSGTGGTAAREALDEIASAYASAYALVVTAGMDYASYVEAIDGKDVLASTEVWAHGVINERLQSALDATMTELEETA